MLFENNKPLVLILGATGHTSRRLFQPLLDTGAFRIASLVRPASESNPLVEALRLTGVEIRVGDFSQDSEEQLIEHLVGVDILISFVSTKAITLQKNILKAAKKVGVKRVVPSDFGITCPPGRREIQDDKIAIQTFIRELGVPYTFIYAGWAMQMITPHHASSPAPSPVLQRSREFFADGNVKTAIMSLDDIGPFVSRIITDPRTLNQPVFCWSEQVTLNEVYALADRVSGEKISDLKIPVTTEVVHKRGAVAKAAYNTAPAEEAYIDKAWAEYVHSIYICGDNTLENAKAKGALDARELYPDFKPETLGQYMKQFYTSS